jgi:UDP-N-acetylmuramate--alanine ligase
VLAFQPHRYTRTRDLFEEFVKVLSRADVLLLAESTPRASRRSRGRRPTLARAVRARASARPVFVEDVGRMAEAIRACARRRTWCSPWAPAPSAT